MKKYYVEYSHAMFEHRVGPYIDNHSARIVAERIENDGGKDIFVVETEENKTEYERNGEQIEITFEE